MRPSYYGIPPFHRSVPDGCILSSSPHPSAYLPGHLLPLLSRHSFSHGTSQCQVPTFEEFSPCRGRGSSGGPASHHCLLYCTSWQCSMRLPSLILHAPTSAELGCSVHTTSTSGQHPVEGGCGLSCAPCVPWVAGSIRLLRLRLISQHSSPRL